MSDPAKSDLRFFDPAQDFTVAWKTLPHWAQAGTVCFITWRTADSLPQEAIALLTRQKHELLLQFGLPQTDDWKKESMRLSPKDRGRLRWQLFTAFDSELHAGCGECVLRFPELSDIVMKSLIHFDGDRYVLTDAVVMPNHVHLLAAFRDEDMLLQQCTSWKHFTAVKINKWLRERRATNSSCGATGPRESQARNDNGEFWQVEQFDHLVRSPEQFEHYRRYIRDNSRLAGLPDGVARHYSKAL